MDRTVDAVLLAELYWGLCTFSYMFAQCFSIIFAKPPIEKDNFYVPLLIVLNVFVYNNFTRICVTWGHTRFI